MKEEIKLTVIYDKMGEVVLVNRNGDTYTSKSEDLMDFLHNAADPNNSTELAK